MARADTFPSKVDEEGAGSGDGRSLRTALCTLHSALCTATAITATRKLESCGLGPGPANTTETNKNNKGKRQEMDRVCAQVQGQARRPGRRLDLLAVLRAGHGD